MKKRESQNMTVFLHLAKGRTLTALEAVYVYDIGRLSARIKDLRNLGHNIKTDMVYGANYTRYGVYTLKKRGKKW